MSDSAKSYSKVRASSILIPSGFVLLLWIIFFLSKESNWNLSVYGMYPRKLEGLVGIFTMPFIHGSWSHLINNSIPLLVLGWAIFHFYRPIAIKTIFWIFLISGIWLWISGRPSYHIGASGLVYGLAAFLFLSGWLRREKRVAALSLLVAFLYGSMWWGVLPVDPGISWEGHLWGGLAGFALAVIFRKQGPQKPEYNWERDEELEKIALGQDKPQQEAEAQEPKRFVYIYKKNSPSSPKGEDIN